MKPKRRFTQHTSAFTKVMRLAESHPAARNRTTLFESRVVRPGPDDLVLKSGEHSRKIGGSVAKGRWADMPIYTLSLEERATCPRDCQHWLTCYGNKMNWSTRWEAGQALEWKLVDEVGALARMHRRGFVVRLHVLGDFYSAGYVRLWERLLDTHPALHVFGYTARDPVGDSIGRQLEHMSRRRWDRFAMRFSASWRSERSAVTLWKPGPVPPSAGVICPAQTGASDCCGTCALCWQTTKNIFFLLH